MADFKANVLLGASFLIFTSSLNEVRGGHASAALFIIMVTGFVAAALVVMAMVPTTAPARPETPNLLFFGVFAGMPEEEFQSRMGELLRDQDKLHQAMVRDIHQLGRVLATRKYKLLGQAYRVFFCGLVMSGIALLGQFAWPILHPLAGS